MSFSVAELNRKLAAVVQIGRVVSIDTGTNTAIVRIGELETHPLPVVQMRSGAWRMQFMPSPGEQVVVFAPGGDLARAVIQGAVPQAGGAVADGKPGPVIDLGAATLTLVGNLDVTGDVTITGDVTVSKDVVASGISLVTHVHGGVVPGGSSTAGPS